jgi:hypothetical protein
VAIPGDDDDSESSFSDPEQVERQIVPPVAVGQPVVADAASLSARSREVARSRDRHFWQGNDSKLNVFARIFLRQPQRQEMLAIASNDPERVAEIRQLKRVLARDFDHDNFKHSAFSFIVLKTCEELNSNQAFVDSYLPANTLLNPELVRQKVKEFQAIAVRANIQDIDSRKYLLIMFTNQMCAANISVAEREQWKLDFREVHDKQQQQIRAIQQDAESGIQNRAIVDNAMGNMIHPPGSNSGRSMQIEAINARVVSQSGHVIARERRESEIIPQVLPVAHRPAVIPAAIQPAAIVGVQQRRPALNQIEDDPLIAAILRSNFSSSSAAAAPVPPSTNFKVQQEARSVELQNMISQHKFCCSLPDEFPEKGSLMMTLAKRIVGFDRYESHCPICRGELLAEINIATLPCCSQSIHTNCLLRIPQPSDGRPKVCPLCRSNLSGEI